MPDAPRSRQKLAEIPITTLLPDQVERLLDAAESRVRVASPAFFAGLGLDDSALRPGFHPGAGRGRSGRRVAIAAWAQRPQGALKLGDTPPKKPT